MSSKSNGHHNGQQLNDFEEIEIPVPWGHISGKWWGSRAVQPIIAIHGWQDNAGTFDNLAPLLKQQGHSILCIELPGHGFSSHLPEGQFCYIFWDGVHILRRIVKYFNWSNITVLGHSLGGGIAFLYAGIFPDEIEKYISIDIASPSVRDPKKMVDNMGKCVDKYLYYETLTADKQPCYGYDEMIDIVEQAYAGSVNRPSCEIMMRRGMKPSETSPGSYVFCRDPRLKVSALGFFTLDQVMEIACRIKCEVLNIRASPGMKLDFPDSYNEVLDKIEKTAAKVERHVVEGTHHLHLNDAPSISGIICDFLE